MFYFDFDQDVVVRVAFSNKKLKRYSAFSHMDLAPLQARFKARSVVLEHEDGTCTWVKNRYHTTEQLTEEELKQFLFQKLASEIVR